MTTFSPDDRIGVYRVVRPLGTGGMGAVYEVVHEKLGVHYALKTFTLDHGHVQLLKERFLAEGRILARLRHPNLVRVFDLDFDAATQTLYFVMDLVLYKDGQPHTLADVEDGSADEAHLTRWFGQLASALDYIHNAEIVHRDVKLNNILLDAHGGVVLSDFGVSRFCSGRLREDLNLHRTVVFGEASTGSLIMGTVGYMAPEVRRGEDATAASDDYSLGIVFFRLLTGVWYEDRPGIWELLEPFDERWRQMLRRLLAENPNDRPILLEPLARQFTSVASSTPTSGSSVARTVMSEKPPSARRRWWIAAAAVLLLAAVVAGTLVLRRSGSKAEPAGFNADNLFSLPATMPDR